MQFLASLALAVLLTLSVVLAATSVPTRKPTSLVKGTCARPSTGCPSRHLQNVCESWDGCNWNATVSACRKDNSCVNGQRSAAPTRLPTHAPPPPPCQLYNGKPIKCNTTHGCKFCYTCNKGVGTCGVSSGR
jgi:hypothetical protein